MKNFIYLDNSKEIFLIQEKYKNQLTKLSNNKSLDHSENVIKYLDKIFEKQKEYDIIITTNYQKILAILLIELCNNYTTSVQKKPNIIISNNESLFIVSLCKKLLKENIIDSITLVNDWNIINEFKTKRQSNTLIAFISNLNNNLIYDLTKISSFCKYYNILLISNLENLIYNYASIENKYFFLNNQDIISLNYYEQKNKLHILFFKKNIIQKYKINTILTNFISNESIVYLINIFNYYHTYEIIQKKIYSIVNDFLSILNKDYKIINYNSFQNIEDIYFTNCVTIVLLNNFQYTSFLLNNIIFSIYIPNSNINNNELINYLKLNGIITNTKFKLPPNISKKILNGIICINLSYLTKSQEILKLIKVLNNVIQTYICKSENTFKNKKKRSVQFSNPEFIILTKPFKSFNKIPLKSILLKK
jgi:hypothetical protein